MSNLEPEDPGEEIVLPSGETHVVYADESKLYVDGVFYARVGEDWLTVSFGGQAPSKFANEATVSNETGQDI